MTHEGGQPVEPRLRIDALLIPAQQAPHRERVPEAMKHRRGDTLWDREGERLDQPMEHLARGRRVHAALEVEAEQRLVITPATVLEMAGEKPTHAGAMGDETALSELAATNYEELALDVHITDAEAARLPRSQPEAVAEGEEGVVGRSAIRSPRIVGEGSSGLEQSTGLVGVEEEGYPPIGFSSAGPYKR